MKRFFSFSALAALLFVAILTTVSCEKEDLAASKPVAGDLISNREANNCTSVTLSYPATIGVDESFLISGAISCGKVMLERAYIMVGLDKVYVGLTCDTPGLLWELVQGNQCPPTGTFIYQSLPEAGTYVYRTKHNRTGSPCSGGNCSFTGNNFCCFVIEAIGCDDESFSYVTTDNLNIVFSYNAGPETGDLTDAVVVFTFPQIMDLELTDDDEYIAPDGKVYTVNNPTNQTVFTWIGDISCDADEAVTFAFSFEPDCSASHANDGKAVIWTDTKVNGESVKGSNANIIYEGCPE